jgi:hypothetical protein
MAEAFSNKLARAVGVVNSSTGGSIGITTNLITGISTTGVTVADLVDTGNYIAGTKVSSIGAGQVVVDRDSTNTAAISGQNVKFLTPHTLYTSTGLKTILIGGTFANNTNNQVGLTVEVTDTSTSTTAAIASKIPVPAGSSFVISDTGKTLLESGDFIKIYCDTANAIDANISILTGVN